MRWVHEATECRTGPTDWATIGARIIQAAAVAAAIHMAERLRVSPQAEAERAPPDPEAGTRGAERELG